MPSESSGPACWASARSSSLLLCCAASFPGGVGKTADAEKFTSLLDDVETKLFGRFGDDTVIYPGHGKDTTLGAERPHLQEWRERGW